VGFRIEMKAARHLGRRMAMLSMKKALVALVVVALVVAGTGALPPRASAGFGSSPGAGYGFGRTAGITDGTSNTIVTPADSLLSRKAGGGPQDYYVVPEQGERR
jgi:hypothetical protein